jgi:phosphoribosylamine---glycine ligase
MNQELKIGRKIAQGSNKEVYEVQGASDLIAFRFTDRVSVFDFGAIPELIPDRGLNLMRFAHVLQSHLSEAGVPSAFDAKASEALGCLVMRKAEGSRWSILKKKDSLEFIPLEVIFRWGAPRGSSLLKRRNDIRPGEMFSEPMIEFSTKLEDQDRLLSTSEANQLLPKNVTLERVRDFATKVAEILNVYFNKLGIVLWDGKIELACDAKGQIILVDAVTPDELRLTLPGRAAVPLSKELLRFWLAKTYWAFEIEEAKANGGRNWKSEVELPPRLNIWRIDRISKLYQCLADTVVKRNVGPILDWMRGEDYLPKVHVTGSGGREAALKRRLAAEGVSLVEDPMRADTVIVSTDGDLANGRVNELRKMGVWTYGPSREAAKIEWSKETGRLIAQRANVPIPHYVVVSKESEIEKALSFIPGVPVVKFDGLAAGKGVVVPATRAEALTAAKKWLRQGPVLLEERWAGVEASVFYAINSSREIEVRYLGCAKDFKRRFLGDEGPNTGGMGAYAPHPDVTDEDILLFSEWARSTAEVLRKNKTPFNGVLYLGLMKDEKKGWGLIEYNARFGDPETQAVLSLWDPSKRVLRYLLQLDISMELPAFISEESKALCLSLVRPEYPEAAPNVEFPEWKLPENDEQQLVLYENESKTGRVGYLVAQDTDFLRAGDRVFQALVESPWKDLVEWRSDILK